MTHDAVILSDLHLGSAACRVRALEDFLGALPATRRLVLNGDVLESTGHRLTRRHWRVLSLLRRLSDEVELVWVAGNHDHDAEPVAHLVGAEFVRRYEFESGGVRCLCVHGDEFDEFIAARPAVTWLADRLYRFAQRLSGAVAACLKRNSKTFLRCCDKVRAGALAAAPRHRVFCGHTHRAESDGVYHNSGCWTEPTCHYLTVSGGDVSLHRVESDGGADDPGDARALIAAEVWAEHRAKPWWARAVERLLGVPQSCIQNRIAFSGVP